MKKTFVFLSIIAIVCSSCSSMRTITIYGAPGTAIYDSYNQQKAIIDYSGKAEVQVNMKHLQYEHFWQAQAKGSKVLVPFALDYVDKNRTGTIGLKMGVGLGFLTPGSIFTGIGGGISGVDKPAGNALLGVGVPLLAIGVASLTTLVNSSYPDFDYEATQKTNNDLIP